MSEGKNTMKVRRSWWVEMVSSVVWGTAVFPAPSLAYLQQRALNERGTSVVRGMGGPRGDRRSLTGLA